MELLVTILNKTDSLEDLLKGFMDSGITGSTIIDSVGMGRALLSDEGADFPILTSLRTVFKTARPYNKTIITVLEEYQVDTAFKIISETVGDLKDKGVGLAFTIPLGKVVGISK